MNKLLVTLFFLISYSVLAQYNAPSLMRFQNTATNTKSASGGLTDAEKQISENYVHEGLQQRTASELCKGNEATCRGSEVETKFLGVDGNLIKAISKAYTTVIGMTDLGKLTKKTASAPKTDAKPAADGKAAQPTATPNANEKKEDQTDYCKYIAVATEVVALFQQTTIQNGLDNIPTNQETAQKDSLYKASRSHDARADNAAIQRNGWAATTLCYGVLATQVQINTSYLIKLGAAGLLTWFYETVRQQNDDAAKLTKSIADKLPGKGYCNPATQRDCYCVQPETKNDPQYCVPEILKNRNLMAGKVATACVNDKLVSDPSCACIQSNTCYNKTFANNVQGFPYGSALIDTFKPVSSMVNGSIDKASLSGGNVGQHIAAINLMKSEGGKLSQPDGLSLTEENEAKAMMKAGVPSSLARSLASIPVNGEIQKNIGKFENSGVQNNGELTNKLAPTGDSKVLEFGGDNIQKRAKSGSKENLDFLNKFGQKEKAPQYGQTVLDFAQKAEARAQINNNKSQSIFQVISRSYQISAMQRLQTE